MGQKGNGDCTRKQLGVAFMYIGVHMEGHEVVLLVRLSSREG